MSLRALASSFRGMKHYLVAAVLAFLVGAVMGYCFPDRFQVLMDLKIEQLQGLARTLNQSPNRQLLLFAVIFLNNTLVSIVMMYAGAVFALLPLYTLVTNGLMLGYLAEKSAHSTGIMPFLKGVLPHGILEIPAVIVACAFGIRFGFLVLESLIRFPFPAGRQSSKLKLISFLRATVPMMLVLAVVLLAAAGVESTLTLWLLGK